MNDTDGPVAIIGQATEIRYTPTASGVSGVIVHWAAGSGSFHTVAMSGTPGVPSVWKEKIPIMAHGTAVSWYVSAVVPSGASGSMTVYEPGARAGLVESAGHLTVSDYLERQCFLDAVAVMSHHKVSILHRRHSRGHDKIATFSTPQILLSHASAIIKHYHWTNTPHMLIKESPLRLNLPTSWHSAAPNKS